jgi:hypothetical protein
MGAGGGGVAGMPKYDANAERAADAYHRVPLPVKKRDSAAAILPVAPATAIRTVSLPSHAIGRLPSDSERLPDGRIYGSGATSAQALVAADPEAVTAYAAAQQDAHYLNTVDGWVAQTGYLSGLGGNNLEVAHGPTAKLLAARPAPRHSRDHLVVLRRKVTQRSR